MTPHRASHTWSLFKGTNTIRLSTAGQAGCTLLSSAPLRATSEVLLAPVWGRREGKLHPPCHCAAAQGSAGTHTSITMDGASSTGLAKTRPHSCTSNRDYITHVKRDPQLETWTHMESSLVLRPWASSTVLGPLHLALLVLLGMRLGHPHCHLSSPCPSLSSWL